jgi:phage tail sheath gpL-like
MAIPNSSIASALAIDVQKKDFSTAAPTLQQRLYAIGQGATLISYLNEKFVATSAGEVGARVGYGSPLHLMAQKIFPPDGSGARSGAVEVTFYPLDDPSGGVAAQKTVDAIGTQTQAAEVTIRINDLEIPLTIPKDTDNDAVVGLIKDAIDAVLGAPVITSQAAGPATAGYMITGAVSAAIAAWQAVTDGEFTISVDGTPQNVTALDFSLDTDLDDVAATIAAGLTGATCVWQSATSTFKITSSATGEGKDISAMSLYSGGSGTDISGPSFCNGLADAVTIVPGTDADQLLTLTAKWAGETSDELDVEIVQETAYGLTFIVEDKTAGAGTVDVQPALDAMGSTWYTMLASQFGDTTNLGKISDKGETLWDQFINRFFVSAVGGSDRSAAETIADARKTDRTNFYVLADDCNAWSFEIGSRGVAEMVSRANLDPNRHYTGLELTGITPGRDSEQPEYTEKDASLKKGVSTTKIASGVLALEDMVSFYHPDNEQPYPGYQWIVDIVKLQNIVNSIRVKFSQPDWEGMTILGDEDISTKPSVRRPKDVKGAYFGLADSWVEEGWMTDSDFTKDNMLVQQSPTARNRFEATVPVLISDSLRQQDYTINFGFNLA